MFKHNYNDNKAKKMDVLAKKYVERVCATIRKQRFDIFRRKQIICIALDDVWIL